MIQIQFQIRNPFKHSPWKSLYEKNVFVTKNKTLEIQITKYTYTLFGIYLDLMWFGQDHAGPCFSICILGYEMGVSLQDNRHWNHEKNNWENYNESNC